MPPAIGILARSPSDPRIKARLSPRIPSDEARSTLALAFLDDLMTRCAAVPGVRLRLAVTPPVEGLRLHRAALPAETFLPQRGVTVPDRLRHVFEDLAASGFSQIVLVEPDLPDLPVEHFEEAFARLSQNHATAVFGPSEEGRCYLVGLNVKAGAVPDLFSGVRWESPYAQDDLTHACERLGLTPTWLPVWNDVDAPGDLDLLIDRLRYAPDSAPHTSATLKTLGLL